MRAVVAVLVVAVVVLVAAVAVLAVTVNRLDSRVDHLQRRDRITRLLTCRVADAAGYDGDPRPCLPVGHP